MCRFGLSAVPDQATSPHLAMGQYDEDLDDDEDYEDEDLDDEAFWEGGKAGRQTRKSTVREVPAGSELDFFSPSTFKGLGASEELQAALQSLSIKTPSHVQAAAFKVRILGPPSNEVSVSCTCQLLHTPAATPSLTLSLRLLPPLSLHHPLLHALHAHLSTDIRGAGPGPADSNAYMEAWHAHWAAHTPRQTPKGI